jgi:integrase
VSLHDARERAAEYRSKAYRGIDPLTDKQRPKHEPPPKVLTFEQASKKVHEQRRSAWSNGKHVDQWINTLRDYAFPTIGTKPIDQIGTPDVLNVLTPIWIAKPETARRVKQRLATVLDWARVAGHRSGDNPVELIGDALPKLTRDQQHHTALPYAEVPTFIGKLRAGTAEPISKLAFEFLILTAARTTEVRKAQWPEVDLTARTWTIPGDDRQTGRRMKSGREHVVPLSNRCLSILAEAKDLGRGQKLIFPDHQTGKAMSENRFLVARDALAYRGKCTPHGFRSSFRDWTAEETAFPPEVAEMALAHTIKNKVEAAYRRGHLLAKRAELMQAWADYLHASNR